MAEENQVQQEPQQVTTKEPQQLRRRVTTKDPKKVEAGRHLAAHNHKKREQKAQKSEVHNELNQYYSITLHYITLQYYNIIAVVAIGGLGYYTCRTKQHSCPQPPKPPKQPPHQCPQSNKFEMD